MTNVLFIGVIVTLAIVLGAFGCYVWVHREIDRGFDRRVAQGRKRTDEERVAEFNRVTGEKS